MNVIVGGRQVGKTYRLMKWALDAPEGETRVIVVHDEQARRAIWAAHPELAVYVADSAAASLRDHVRDSITGKRLVVGVDDLEVTLPALLRCPVDRVTLTEWMAEVIPPPPALHPNAVKVYVQLLTNCARCGGDHHGIEWRPLQRSIDDMTHWAPCPANGEPILMRMDTVPSTFDLGAPRSGDADPDVTS